MSHRIPCLGVGLSLALLATQTSSQSVGTAGQPSKGPAITRTTGPVAGPKPNITVVQVGGPGSIGANGTSDPALLSDGSVATGVLTFSYDVPTSVFTVTVENTTVPTTGLAPRMSAVDFNLPLAFAASDATLLGQLDALGADPGFTLQVDSNPYDTSVINDAGLLGGFSLRLTAPIHGGIAATGSPVLPGEVVGPVTFRIELIGPALKLDQLTPEFPRRLLSRPDLASGSTLSVQAAAAFAGGGDGTGAGLASSPPNGCSPIMFWSGDNRIGHMQFLFLQAAPGCHGCQLWSQILGPSSLDASYGFQLQMGGSTNDIGVFFPYLFISQGFTSLPYMIPDKPELVGLTFYWHFVTNPVLGIATDFEVSPLITMTILP